MVCCADISRRFYAVFFLLVMVFHGGAEWAALGHRCLKSAQREAAAAERAEKAQAEASEGTQAAVRFLTRVSLVDATVAEVDEEEEEAGSCCDGKPEEETAVETGVAVAVAGCCTCECCGDKCPNGANCRCGHNQPDYGITGFIINLPGCHNGPSPGGEAAFPQSMSFRFLAPRAPVAEAGPAFESTLIILSSPDAIIEWSAAPPTPPPEYPVQTA